MDMGLPRFVAPYLTVISDDPETAARAYFAAYSGLYGVQSLDQALQLSQIQSVNAGTLVRFQQYLDDLPVYGGQAIVSLTGDVLISFVNIALQPTAPVSMDLKIDQQEAVQAAIEYSGDTAAELAREPQLMIFSPMVMELDENPPVPVWELGLFVGQDDGGPPLMIQYLVDAVNGKVIYDQLEDLGVENWIISSAQNSVTDDPKPKAKYDKVVKWYEMNAGDLSIEVDEDNQPLADAEGDVTQQNMDLTWDYFFNTHAWDGHDNNGGVCNHIVHVGSGWGNASCNASCNCKFGDANGGWGSAIDVLVHEFMHAITGQTAGLKYRQESGALNEHYSDSFAAMVDTSDWLMTEPTAVRNISEPPSGSRSSPDHWEEFAAVEEPNKDNDNGWVHFNSGIPNKASFLVADTVSNIHPDSGVEVQGLGREVAEQIWFQTLLTLGPTTGLPQWASSTVGTTYGLVPDLLSEEDACQVQYAMQAVGLREPDCRCDDEDKSDCPLNSRSSQSGVDPDSGDGETGDGDEGETETEGSPSPEGEDEIATPEPTPMMVNACDHPYLPVRVGSTWSYQDGEGQSSEYIVREVTGDEDYAEAIVDSVIVGPDMAISMTHTWTCDDEGIRAPITSMSGMPEGVEATIFGEQEGVLLPRGENLKLGSQWSYNTLFVMDFSTAEVGSFQVSNDRQEQFTAQQFTQISVPAGEFEALEVSGTYTVETDVTFSTRTFTGTETLWFVEGVGLVKDYGEQDGAYFIELVDYFIPER